MLDRKIDPSINDYVRAPRGLYLLSDEVENKLALAYSIALGEWEGDPLIGHRLDELNTSSVSAGTMITAKSLLEQAAQWIIDGQFISSVSALVLQLDTQGIYFEVTATNSVGYTVAKKNLFVALGGA